MATNHSRTATKRRFLSARTGIEVNEAYAHAHGPGRWRCEYPTVTVYMVLPRVPNIDDVGLGLGGIRDDLAEPLIP